jgi:hypothetical protein
MRVTIIADDKTVIVNGTSVVLAEFPALDANVHAVQFYPETGHATIEKKAGEREHVAGDVALALVKPFVDGHSVEAARLKAAIEAEAAAREAAERAIRDRHDQIRAELAAADQKAAEVVRAAEAERQRQASAAPTAPTGNMISSGTRAI